MNEDRKRQFFARLAPSYSDLTSNTTQDIFAKFLDSYAPNLNLTSSSVVHDNASGPGTATQILVQHATKTGITPTIIATDYAAKMIETLRDIQAAEFASTPAWNHVKTEVLDSSDLSTIPDATFTHSISNFSLFTMTSPVRSLQETHRTLSPGGTVVIILWKRFAIQYILAAAQDHVKGDGYAMCHAVPVAGPQYYERGFVRKQLVGAGFNGDGVETWPVDVVVREGEEDREKWEGMVRFMTSSSVGIAGGSTRGWSEEETGRWEEAVRWAMGEESRKGGVGGIRFEGWVNVVRK